MYKLVHFIAPTAEIFDLWKSTLEEVLENRSRGFKSGTSGGSGEWEALRWREVGGAMLEEAEQTQEPEEIQVVVEEKEVERVVREEEVIKLCRRLGMGLDRDEIGIAFQVNFSLYLGGDQFD